MDRHAPVVGRYADPHVWPCGGCARRDRRAGALGGVVQCRDSSVVAPAGALRGIECAAQHGARRAAERHDQRRLPVEPERFRRRPALCRPSRITARRAAPRPLLSGRALLFGLRADVLLLRAAGPCATRSALGTGGRVPGRHAVRVRPGSARRALSLARPHERGVGLVRPAHPVCGDVARRGNLGARSALEFRPQQERP